MTDALRPAEYREYRDVAESILTQQSGPAALRAFGLDELFRRALHDPLPTAA